MRKVVICICALALLAACSKEVPNTTLQSGELQSASSAVESSPSQAVSVPESPAESEESEGLSPTPQIGEVDINGAWTAHSATFPFDYDVAYYGLVYQGRLDENRLVFTGNGSDAYEKTTIAVLDISDLENMKFTAVRQFYEPDVFCYVSVQQNMVLCQYGAIAEVMDETLKTVRTISVPLENGERIQWCSLNDDFSMAAYSPADPISKLDFENCTIVVQPLDGSGKRLEFSAFMGTNNYYTALIRPELVANGKKIMVSERGHEFTASYVLMDLDGQNRRSYNHGGSYFNISDKIIGNDFYIKNVYVELEGGLQVPYLVLHKIDTVTGEETQVYKATEKGTVIIDYNKNYVLFKETFIPEDNKIIRDKYYLFDFESGKTEPLSEEVCLALNAHSSISLTDDSKIIAQRRTGDGSASVTIFVKNDK